MMNFLTFVFIFLAGIATALPVSADLRCEAIFSREVDGESVSVESDAEIIARGMLRNTPEYFASIQPIKIEGNEYLEIHFSPSANTKAGFGFSGGTYAESMQNLDTRIVRFFESYGIKVLSTDHLIVPTPRTLRILHQSKLNSGKIRSVFEPVAVRGRISDLQYLQLISRGKWPIDATGSIEYLHDLLNHWPAAAFTPRRVAEMQIQTAKAGVLILKDNWTQNGSSRRIAEYIAKKIVNQIDENNSITHLKSGISHMIPRTTQSMASIFRILVKLSAYDNRLISDDGAVSSASRLLVLFRTRQIVKELNLDQNFTIMWNVKEENLASTIYEAYLSRMALFDDFNSLKD